MSVALLGATLVVGVGCGHENQPNDCYRIRATVGAIGNAAGSPCSTDLDCVVVSDDLSCYSGCGASISRANVDHFQKELVGLESDLCAGATCRPEIDCAPGAPVCFQGHCTIKIDLDGGGQ